MMAKKYSIWLGFGLWISTSLGTQAQTVEIDVNLNVRHQLGDITDFDRAKFISIHADVDDKDWYDGNGFTENLIDDFLNGYDVYMGRNTGGVQWIMNGVVTEDPNRPGYAQVSTIEEEGKKSRDSYAKQTAWHPYEARNKKVLCTQLHPFYPDGKKTNKGWAFSQADTEATPWGTASGEFYAHYIKNFFGTGGKTGQPMPSYVEITNEPLWDLYNEIEEAFKFHTTVAKEVKKINPDVLVAGYCTAFPNLEENNFKRWEDRWKKFMDTSGEYMDCWSIHLYDFPAKGGKKQLRRGSNVEATFDMLEQYSVMKFGKVKPFLVTEYGASSHDYKGKWSPYIDYLHNTAANAMVMQFMERANNIGTAINYTMLKATWGTSAEGKVWDARLLRQANEPESLTGEWVYTDRVHFYQLWAHVKGKRIDSYQTNLDIMTDAYVDGNKAYVILNNLAWEDQNIRLHLYENQEMKPTSLLVKHYRLEDKNPVTDQNGGVLEETTYNSAEEIPATFTIGAEGTIILEYTFATPLELTETAKEVKYYAQEYYQPIKANETLTFTINNVKTNTYGEAVLRIGLGRNHGRSLRPVVNVNGTEVSLPTKHRGDAQKDRETFFGVIEVPIANELIKESNTITLSFKDADGYVSSMAMQVFGFSKPIKRTTQKITDIEDEQLQGGIRVFPNPAGNYVIVDLGTEAKEAFTLKLFNTVGQSVFQQEKAYSQEKIDVSQLNNGLYIYNLFVGNEIVKGSLLIEKQY